jgi:hypothetical protein
VAGRVDEVDLRVVPGKGDARRVNGDSAFGLFGVVVGGRGSIRSVTVVFPASMWAMMPMFRILERVLAISYQLSAISFVSKGLLERG